MASQLGVSADHFHDTVAWRLRRACWSGGLQAMLDAGFMPKKHAGIRYDGSSSSGGVDGGPSTSEPATSSSSGGGRGGKMQYWKRQYMFVAATMPAALSADVGTNIKDMYPDAVWLSGDLLHRSKPQVGSGLELRVSVRVTTELVYKPKHGKALRSEPRVGC